MKRLLALCLLLMSVVLATSTSAEELMMVRVKQAFPETMLKFQAALTR